MCVITHHGRILKQKCWAAVIAVSNTIYYPRYSVIVGKAYVRWIADIEQTACPAAFLLGENITRGIIGQLYGGNIRNQVKAYGGYRVNTGVKSGFGDGGRTGTADSYSGNQTIVISGEYAQIHAGWFICYAIAVYIVLHRNAVLGSAAGRAGPQIFIQQGAAFSVPCYGRAG